MSQSSEKEYARRAQLRVSIGGHALAVATQEATDKDSNWLRQTQSRETAVAIRKRGSPANGYRDATSALMPSLLEFTFTDHAGGKADEVQLTLHDREGHWNSDWKPRKGLAVTASITVKDWFGPGQDACLPCGTFRIDELEFTGPPDKVSIKAVSSALTGGLRDEAKTRAWENSSLRDMAGQVAQEHGLKLLYQGNAHSFGRQDQRNESDLSFVNRVAEERAMHCKVHDGKLVIYDKAGAETAEAVISVARTAAEGGPHALAATRYSFKQSSSKTGYDKARVVYADPTQGAAHTATVEAAPADGAPADAKTLALDARVESAGEAMRLGKAALHNANAKENSARLEFMGHPGVVAGVTLTAVGFGDFSGHYFVRKAEHKVSGSGGYTTSVELTGTRIRAHARSAATSKEMAARPAYTPPAAPANPTEQWEREFTLFRKFWELAGADKLTRLLLCLPDIAAAMAEKQSTPEDRQGWLYLREMFFHWFSGRTPSGGNTEPFWVDWNWVMSFERAAMAYAQFVDLIPSIEQQIMNYPARRQLAAILRRNNLLRNGRTEFNFIETPWTEWEDKYHTLMPVPRSTTADGLMVALAGFTLRALAKGHVEPSPKGGYVIHVNEIAVFVHDKFQFEEDTDIGANRLGYWSCEEKDGALNAAPYGKESLYSALYNETFRIFRNRLGNGGDFLVLSHPHHVDNFHGVSYAFS